MVVLAGSITVAALGWIKDSSAAKHIRDELTRMEKRDEHRNSILISLRHYINVLIAWGAHAEDPPPRKAPEPPDALTKENEGSDD